ESSDHTSPQIIRVLRSNESSDHTSPQIKRVLRLNESSDQTSPEIKRVLRSNESSDQTMTRCLSSALQVGCSAFACLEKKLSFQMYVGQNIYNISNRARPLSKRASSALLKASLPRYYSTLLQSLMECDEDTVGVVRSGLVAKLGPDMDTLFQLLQKKPCSADGETDGQDSFRWPLGPPTFKIQPSLNNRDPNHLFARKRSVEK
ncbi:stanniocalcin-like, partial [Astyanax mexicanus]